jgi:hypothetical protein
MNSRNHHMFASVGGWLYEDLAGISQVRRGTAAYDPSNATQRGFAHPILFPRVTTHPNVSFVEAEYASISGRFAVTWVNPNTTVQPGATCAEDAPENAPYAFSCANGGKFTAVLFASFGTPSGTCGNFALGDCNAANSTAIVSAACLGQQSCSIDVADTLFGDVSGWEGGGGGRGGRGGDLPPPRSPR